MIYAIKPFQKLLPPKATSTVPSARIGYALGNGHQEQSAELRRSAPNGLKLLSAGEDHSVRVWDLRGMKELVRCWHADREVTEAARKATKTSTMILAYITNAGQPQTPSLIASALPIPRERAKKAMRRMMENGKLRRTKEGYIPGDSLGTFCCITTLYRGAMFFFDCSVGTTSAG